MGNGSDYNNAPLEVTSITGGQASISVAGANVTFASQPCRTLYIRGGAAITVWFNIDAVASKTCAVLEPSDGWLRLPFSSLSVLNVFAGGVTTVSVLWRS